MIYTRYELCAELLHVHTFFLIITDNLVCAELYTATKHTQYLPLAFFFLSGCTIVYVHPPAKRTGADDRVEAARGYGNAGGQLGCWFHHREGRADDP